LATVDPSKDANSHTQEVIQNATRVITNDLSGINGNLDRGIVEIESKLLDVENGILQDQGDNFFALQNELKLINDEMGIMLHEVWTIKETHIRRFNSFDDLKDLQP
jgi:hypothetical protein